MSAEAADHYRDWPEETGKLKNAAPDLARAFGGMYQRLMSPGALTLREKELIAFGVGMALRCERCIYAHTEKAVQAGLSREELLEAAGVVVMMQGGPGYVYVPKVIDALDALDAR